MAVAERVAPFQQHSYSDLELVSAVRRGSDRAFEELYGRYFARVRGYVLGMVRDHGRAEDLTQEIFFSALRRLKATENPIAFKPWVFEIAKNACIDEFRRARRGQEVPLEDDDGEAGEYRWSSAASAPEAAVENKQRLVDLRGAFQGLSENHHHLLVMREFEGLSYDQIGERLGMSRPVVESSLFRARRKLNAEYQELVSGRRCEAVQGVIASEDERSLRSLGVRQRRLLSRHLAHCQPCRRVARDAHLDESWFKAPPVRSKLAALLPFGWWRWRWREPKDEEGAASLAATVPHHVLLSPPWSGLAALGNATASMPGAGRAAAAAAAIAVAGLGGSAITGIGNGWVPGVGGGGSHQAASRRGPNPGSAGAARSSAAGRGSAAGISASTVVAGATQFQAPSQLASAAASASGRHTSGLHAAGTSPAAASAVRLPSGASTASSLPGIALPTNAGQTPTLPATPTSPVGAPAHGSGLVPAGSSVVKYGLGPARGAAGTVGEVTSGVGSTAAQAVQVAPSVPGQVSTIAGGVAASAGSLAAAAAGTITAGTPVSIPVASLPSVPSPPALPGGAPPTP